METLVAKKKNESQALPKKSSLFPPSPVIVWIQQGNFIMCIITCMSSGGCPKDTQKPFWLIA